MIYVQTAVIFMIVNKRLRADHTTLIGNITAIYFKQIVSYSFSRSFSRNIYQRMVCILNNRPYFAPTILEIAYMANTKDNCEEISGAAKQPPYTFIIEDITLNPADMIKKMKQILRFA